MPRSKAAVKKASEKVHEKKKLTSQKIARKSAPVETGVKKRRAKAGRVALKEIKKYQKQTKPMLQRAPFQRKSKCFFDV
jgi:histone H3